ncbi:MAG TPA: sulfatase-like hydrolase/transferase [Chloroflexota bacterium]|nr:sulfatase-like hydrolase/transferase [Chloroflexota bacterium]
MADRRPNFLIIMSDEHDPQVSSPYGHPFIHTPAIQRLADRGTVFENAYCNSPLCVPSRASFMTGKHLHRIGVWDNGVPLASDEPTWAHRLNGLGYDTALAGKMHFVGLDQRHGFRERLVEDVHGSGRMGGPNWDNGIKDGGTTMRKRIEEAGPGDSAYQQYDDEVVSRSVEYIQSEARANRPWALCASIITPHFPLIVRQPYFDRYFPEHADLPNIPDGHLDQLHPAPQRLRTHFSTRDYTDAQIARARAVYYGLISFCDDKIGALLDAVDASGQADNTVIMYVADHGEMHGEHGMWWKCTFFEQASRIPTIISWPGHFSGGQRASGVVSLLDVVRTVVELAGGSGNDFYGLDGDSLVPLLLGQPNGWKDLALVEYEGHGTVTPARMVRRGRYKLNYYLNEPAELYDLVQDPNELVNLAGRPEFAGLQDELTALVLTDWDPDEVNRRVHESQRQRHILAKGDVMPRTSPWGNAEH